MNASAFLDLQDIDTALDVITHQRPRLPEVTANADANGALASLQARIAAARQRIADATDAIEASERAASELTKKRTRLEAQLKTIIAPREAEALLHEIELMNGQRGELDDQELEALAEQDAAEAVVAALSAELPGLEAAVAVARAQLDAALAALDVQTASLREQRERAVAAMGTQGTDLYERVRSQFGGVGVARLEGSHCSGCHMDLSPRELDLVKQAPADTLAECPQCGRIIVR